MDPFGYYIEAQGRRQFEISVEDLYLFIEGGRTDQIIDLLRDRGFNPMLEIDCIMSHIAGESVIFFQKGLDH